MANKQSTDVLSTIGAMQTLVENFPMGITTVHNIKSYTSTMDFLMDCFKTVGVTDSEIIELILKKITGVNDLSVEETENPEDIDENKFQNNKFIDALEKTLKFTIAQILANIVSCDVWPLVPENAIREGIDIPIDLLDSNKLFNTCPVSPEGLRLYQGIVKGQKISDLVNTTDLNAVMWYCINMTNIKGVTSNSVVWSDRKKPTSGNICTLNNRGMQKINIQIGENYLGRALHTFNMRYLDNIQILSPKSILMNVLYEYAYGRPNINVDMGFNDIYQEAMFKKMITTIVSNNDLGVEDCYYTFSNEEWYRLLEESELRKYNAKKMGEKSNTAVPMDKDSMLKAMEEASSASSIYARTSVINDAIMDAASTRTVENNVLVSEGGVSRNFTFDFAYNSEWLYNILSTIITPIMRAVLTPKVMALVIINYNIAGAINLSEISEAQLGVIIEGVRRKLLGIIAALTKKVSDWIIDILLSFFNEKIMPLITKYLASKLREQLDYYLDLLRQALECVSLFGWPQTRMRGNATTGIDDVRYADIIEDTTVKNNPQKTDC